MDPVLLQKQIRDNSEDLNSYLSELKTWEEDMKRKEREIYNDQSGDESLPPVRRKIKTEEKRNVQQPHTNETSETKRQLQPANLEEPTTSQLVQSPNEKPQTKKIASYDYAAWDKFDVDEACKEVDTNISNTNSHEKDETPIKNLTEKERLEEANYEKENGNSLVKRGKWREAVECYTRAINYDSNNAIFYANRALCYIKLEMWHMSLEDSDKALAIEPGYVKAMLRRATACLKLKDYTSASADWEAVLKLEPDNMDAKKGLAAANVHLKKPFNSKGESSIEENNGFIKAIHKAPHLRSRVPLRRVPIQEVGACTELKLRKSSLGKISELPSPITPDGDTPSSTLEEQTTSLNPTDSSVKEIHISTPSSPLKSPTLQMQLLSPEDFPKPRTSVQFLFGWSQLCHNLRYNYLEQLNGSQLPSLFGDSLESKIVTEVLEALDAAPKGARIFEYLLGLSEARRFSTISMFMSSNDKAVVTKLLELCLNTKQCSEEQRQDLAKKYEL